MGARSFEEYTRSRNGAGVNVGAPQPRMTMHTKPLSPWAATLYPEAVSILTVACTETFSGAALLANATSASGVIMYSLSGGYLEAWGRAGAGSMLAKNTSNTNVSFFMFVFISFFQIYCY